MIESGWLLALLLALLLCSAFLNAAEAALFSLSPAQRKALGNPTEELLRDPRRVLATVLLAKLVVTTLYFAFAARLQPEARGWRAALLAVYAVVLLLLCSEILPKVLGLRGRRGVARAAAPLLTVVVSVLEPLARPLLWALELAHRGLRLWVRQESGLTPQVLARVLERGAARGALHEREADLLTGILELEDIRVREIMRPRVDTLFLDVSGEERASVLASAIKNRVTWLPVIEGEPDRVLGRVDVRDLVGQPERSIRQLVMPVKFVPEVASVLDALRALREDSVSEAVVVDEFGGTAGVVTVEDAFEQILGDLPAEGEEPAPAPLPLGEGRFRVPGELPIREWNEAFGLRVVPREFETVGGFVTALLGRIPRAGDQVRVGELELEVHEVRRRRVLTVDIGVCTAEAPRAKQEAGA